MKHWQNSDMKNLGSGLLDHASDDYPYLAEIRDNLNLLIGIGTTGNNQREYFNITNVTQLEADIQTWQTANPDVIITSKTYLRDAAGTNILMITYM